MHLHKLFSIGITLCFAAVASAESFSGSAPFSTSADHAGEIWFTALDPGETSSSLSIFAGYSQLTSTDYTYLYLLENNSDAGTPTSFGNEHSFYGIDLVTLLDPNGSGINSIGSDASNGGEDISDAFAISPDLISFEFDNAPNYGIEPEGGFSAVLRFYSPFGPSDAGGAYFTQNTPGNDFTYLDTGVTTPVPEPGTGALLAMGLLALGRRRSR